VLPTDFKFRNIVLGKPKSMTDEECVSLPAWTNGNMYISKWRLNKEELEMIQNTGEIYLQVTSAAHPPVCPMVECPFEEGNYVVVGDKVRGLVTLPGHDPLEIEGIIEDINGLLVVNIGRTRVPFYLIQNAQKLS
jgi:hypothetical protein